MSPWLHNLYMDGVVEEDVRLMENGREWRVASLMYDDDLVSSDEFEV